MQRYPAWQSLSLWQGQTHLPWAVEHLWPRHVASCWQGKATEEGSDVVLAGAGAGCWA